MRSKIKRVVFESLRKFDGRLDVPLASSQIKQIGGRAGRYYAAPQGPSRGASAVQGLPAGEVLTLEERDMDELRDKMDAPVAPMTRAMLRAPPESLEAIARLMPPTTPLSHLFGLRHALTRASPLFRICDERNPIKVAEVLEAVVGLSLRHRLVFANAPANARDPLVLDALRRWAVQHAHGREADFSAWWAASRWAELLREDAGRANEDDIRQLESAHRCLTLYLWLAARLPQTFTADRLCTETKLQVERSLMSQISQPTPTA